MDSDFKDSRRSDYERQSRFGITKCGTLRRSNQFDEKASEVAIVTVTKDLSTLPVVNPDFVDGRAVSINRHKMWEVVEKARENAEKKEREKEEKDERQKEGKYDRKNAEKYEIDDRREDLIVVDRKLYSPHRRRVTSYHVSNLFGVVGGDFINGKEVGPNASAFLPHHEKNSRWNDDADLNSDDLNELSPKSRKKMLRRREENRKLKAKNFHVGDTVVVVLDYEQDEKAKHSERNTKFRSRRDKKIERGQLKDKRSGKNLL